MKHWLQVRAQGNTPEIVIDGPIGSSWWDDSGTSSKEFRDALDKIPKGTAINLRINSEGGSIQDGLGIYNAIKDRRADVTAIVDGYAVSIASVIPLAAGKVVSPKSSIWMIHEPWSFTQGNAEDHLKSAEMLDKHGEMLAQIYADETGHSKQECREAMKAESWYTGSEAAEFGLADECPDEDGDEPEARFSGLRNGLNVVGRMCAIPERILAALLPPKPAENKPAGQAASINNKGTMPEPTTAAAQPSAEIEALKEQAKAMSALLEKEKRTRVTAEVTRRAENKIQNANLGFWIDLAMKGDENAIYSQIEALPMAAPAGAPVGGSPSISIADTESQRVMKLPTAAQRYEAWKKTDWTALMADALAREERNERVNMPANNPYGFKRGSVQGANTYSATLVTSFLLDGATTILQPKLTPVMAFTREFSTDPYKPKATHVHKYVSAASSTVEDCTDWEPALADTIDPISVTMHQETQIFGVSNSDLNSGLRMEDLAKIHGAKIGQTIIEKATAPITVANFGTTPGTTGAGLPLVKTATNFGYSDLTTLRGYIKNASLKNLILDGSYFAQVTNLPTFYQQAGVAPGGGWKIFGWDFIGECNDWTGAAANTQGFACDPQAILVVAGIPLSPPSVPGNTLQEGRLTVPEVGLTIGAYTWFSLQYRTLRTSFDLMFGASAMDKTAGTMLMSA